MRSCKEEVSRALRRGSFQRDISNPPLHTQRHTPLVPAITLSQFSGLNPSSRYLCGLWGNSPMTKTEVKWRPTYSEFPIPSSPDLSLSPSPFCPNPSHPLLLETSLSLSARVHPQSMTCYKSSLILTQNCGSDAHFLKVNPPPAVSCHHLHFTHQAKNS